MTAVGIYERFADKQGLISLSDLAKVGWTKDRAENEGLVIKEDFYYYDTNKRKTEVKENNK